MDKSVQINLNMKAKSYLNGENLISFQQEMELLIKIEKHELNFF